MIVNPMDNIGSYISTQGVPTSIISRDGNYSTAYSATIPMGINPQSLYIQNPASVTGFQNTTGHQFASAHNFSLVPQNVMPNPIHIKTRVYVPNQIVGILIGTKGQTIKSVIAECGLVFVVLTIYLYYFSAIIRIEGDRDSTPSSSSVHQNANNSVAASQENSYNNNKSTTTCVEDPSVISSVNSCDHLQETGDNTSNGPIVAPAVDSLGTCETTTTCQINGGHKKNSVVTGHPPSPDQRGVFISGYDFQVSRVCFVIWQI
uniref:KH_dom_type_1 domain-containing protein n=1 Tax=Meloidogyne hapla TaxID=6305 RepID=A0A1I8BUS4_MELHA